jgi:hypothetical protein
MSIQRHVRRATCALVADSVRPLNPDLYERLRLAFGAVEIEDTVAPLVFAAAVRGGRIASKIVANGETYRVRCPFCRGARIIAVCHFWGQPDPLNDSPLHYLAFCPGRCLRGNYGEFLRRVLGVAGREADAALKAMRVDVGPRLARADSAMP